MIRAVALVLLFARIAIVALCVSQCSRSTVGEHHEAPRVTPGPVAGSAGSRTIDQFVSEAGRRMTPARSATLQKEEIMSETLGSWPWVAINPAKPKEPKRFDAVTYIEARAAAAAWFRIPETVVRVRVVFEYELAKPASGAA